MSPFGIPGVKDPQFVQDIEESQSISIVFSEDPDDQAIGLLQYDGDKRQYEWYDNGHGLCSDDGQLWSANDHGSLLTCTNHTFPLEQSGYELVEVKPESNYNSPNTHTQ